MAARYLPKILLALTVMSGWGVFSVNAAEPLQVNERKQPADYVNPFVGTTNFGTTNPGAVCPNGMMSVSPFNVMGSDENVWDKDRRW